MSTIESPNAKIAGNVVLRVLGGAGVGAGPGLGLGHGHGFGSGAGVSPGLEDGFGFGLGCGTGAGLGLGSGTCSKRLAEATKKIKKSGRNKTHRNSLEHEGETTLYFIILVICSYTSDKEKKELVTKLRNIKECKTKRNSISVSIQIKINCGHKHAVLMVTRRRNLSSMASSHSHIPNFPDIT